MLGHDIFYNRERSNYEELMSYYPVFWKEILDMRVNNKFAGYTLDRAAEGLEQAVSDQFFDTCSEFMIARYENFLDLDNSDRTLEERRRFLKVAWNGTGKISVSIIIDAIREFYGEMVEVDVEFTDFFLFTIHNLNVNPDIDRKIDEYLCRVIPAHIGYTVVYEAPLECVFYAAGAMSVGEVLEIRQVF